ncbi:MAG: DUF4230 domain-containing protein [Prevotella sp.]|nr:DUF4230 domain-containing protein [Prevotella sp.]
MKEIIDSILRFIKGVSLVVWFSILGIVVLIVAGAALMAYINKDNHLQVSADQRIDITPAQIESIRQIGQWEFLSVSDEELIDTVDRGFFRDKELVRIYYGTLRLGVDLQKTRPDWINISDTIVVAKLPAIELLDHNFIDEARTRSFFESGSWTAEDREKLYQRAYNKMMTRCLSKQNLANAEANGRIQFTQLLRSMGFTKVRIEFGKETK